MTLVERGAHSLSVGGPETADPVVGAFGAFGRRNTGAGCESGLSSRCATSPGPRSLAPRIARAGFFVSEANDLAWLVGEAFQNS